MLVELARREKIAGIKPDEDLDIFIKVLLLLNSWQVSFFLPDNLSLQRFDHYHNFLCPVISFGGTGDRSSCGVHYEGILY